MNSLRSVLGISLLLVATSTMAQTYAGIRVAVTSINPNISGARFGNIYHVDDNRTVTNLYAGYTRGAWSVEIGGGSLGRRRSHNISDTYDIVQNISAGHVYAGILRHWRLGDFSAHAMLGVTRVMFKNHEFGWNENGPDQMQLNYGADTAPIYGLGAAYRLTSTTTVRLDAFRIPKVVRSHWTRPHSDINGVSLGLQWGL